MTARRRTLWITVSSVVLVLTLVVAAVEPKSPGAISATHAQVEALAGGNACAACHGGWFRDMRSACLECHEAVAEQFTAGHGLHGTLPDTAPTRCADCHGEHLGHDFTPVNPFAFAQAGVHDVQAFDHAVLGFELAGAHRELACAACHPNADATVLAPGEQRFTGQVRDCASCHLDAHDGRMQTACARCHDQFSFQRQRVLEHARHLPLTGSHANLDCRTCHAVDAPAALENLTGTATVARGCVACHKSPHAPAFVLGNAGAHNTAPEQACGICHPSVEHGFTSQRTALAPAQHAHSGFALLAPHDDLDCDRCHQPNGSFVERHPGRSARACNACHEDPHGGQFAEVAAVADGEGAIDCLACHRETHFAPTTFDRERHAETRLPLDGAHAEADCHACHREPPAGQARRFHDTPHRCDDCHDDVHGTAFDLAREQLDGEPRGSCATCHVTRSFGEVDAAAFAHGHWTGFAIDGAHAQVDCSACHARSESADANGRHFGRALQQRGPHGSCTSCHRDPHRGHFDRDDVPAEADGRFGCRRCHDTASFRALPHGFAHGHFTGFELTGKHGELDCSACHQPLAVADTDGRTWAEAAGHTCAACHDDPHAGQFARNGETDCRRCHQSQTTFSTLTFRHNLDSRFKLGEQHRNVACRLCHKPEVIAGRERVRYKPLPTRCVDCHGRQEGGGGRRRRR